jgi:hypothetical protein
MRTKFPYLFELCIDRDSSQDEHVLVKNNNLVGEVFVHELCP